jgi:hypothetical protein
MNIKEFVIDNVISQIEHILYSNINDFYDNELIARIRYGLNDVEHNYYDNFELVETDKIIMDAGKYYLLQNGEIVYCKKELVAYFCEIINKPTNFLLYTSNGTEISSGADNTIHKIIAEVKKI